MTVGKHWDHPLTFVLTDEEKSLKTAGGSALNLRRHRVLFFIILGGELPKVPYP